MTILRRALTILALSVSVITAAPHAAKAQWWPDEQRRHWEWEQRQRDYAQRQWEADRRREWRAHEAWERREDRWRWEEARRRAAWERRWYGY